MGLADIFALALALGADCFSVCLSLAMDPGTPKRTLLLSVVFGGLQGALVALGYQVALGIHWLLDATGVGRALAARWPFSVRLAEVQQELHWILSAAGTTVLLAVGIGLISDFLSPGSKAGEVRLFRGLPGLMLVGLTVNLDAFSAGVGMGMLDGAFLPQVVAVMIVVGSGLCRLGFEAGNKVGTRIGRIAQPLAGALIILVALKAIAGMVIG